MKDSIDPLVEWAVWGHLDSKTDLELLLLKGHLLMEVILDTTLSRNDVSDYKNYSFHRKIITLENLQLKDKAKKEFIISSLKDLNRLRNKVAHEFHSEIDNGEFQLWSSNILEKLKGKKFTKYTFRTKIVHSFSILAKNILELTDTKKQKTTANTV